MVLICHVAVAAANAIAVFVAVVDDDVVVVVEAVSVGMALEWVESDMVTDFEVVECCEMLLALAVAAETLSLLAHSY